MNCSTSGPSTLGLATLLACALTGPATLAKVTGAVVWERPIDTSPREAPMTYLHEGTQYLVLGVGGGDSPPGLRAYTLPD